MSTLLHRTAPLILAALTLAVAGCGGVLSNPEQRRLYQVAAPTSFGAGLPHVRAQLTVGPVDAGAGLDTPRIALARSPLTLDYFAEVAWSDKAPALVRTAMIQAFENSGAFSAVGSDTFSLRTDYLLKSELRNFEAVYDSQSGNPVATVALSLKLVKLPGDTISAQTVISQRQPAASNAIPDIVGAFNIALGKALQEAVGWTASHAASVPARR